MEIKKLDGWYGQVFIFPPITLSFPLNSSGEGLKNFPKDAAQL